MLEGQNAILNRLVIEKAIIVQKFVGEEVVSENNWGKREGRS